MLKRTLSIILAVAMLCTLVPAYTLAEEVVGETVAVENEEIVAVEETAEEDLVVVPMAQFDTSLLVDEDGVQQPVGITMPEILANVNVSAAVDKLKTATVNDLPSNSITYVLVDSDNPAYSNFTSDFEGTWITSGTGSTNVWVYSTGANTRRSDNAQNVSEHTATIVVPESVGPEGKEFQIVSMNIRTATNSDPNRYGLNGRGALVWIDDVPVATDITKGHDCIGNIQSHLLWVEKGMVNWELSASGSSTYYMWDWGPTVTLTPGVHTVKFQPAGTSNGGRVPGFIITDAIGYDWTKIVPILNKSTTFGDQIGNAAKDFAGSFGAAGYLDFVAPEFDGEIVVDSDKTTASKIVFSVPAAKDTVEDGLGSGEYKASAYSSFVPVDVKAYVDDEEVEIVDGVVTVEGLSPDTAFDISVVALDAVGNATEITATAKTLGADSINYAYFGAGAKITNLTEISESESKLTFEWTPAIAGTADVAEPVITYNVYVDGVLKAENISATKYTVTGLSPDSTYDIKVVTCSDGVEAAEDDIASALEITLPTAKTPEIKEVADKTTATSTVLEVSSLMDPASFDFAIKEVILNGSVTKDVSINGNLITVNGLVSGVSNTIKVTTIETQKSTGSSAPVNYPMITVKALADDSFTLKAEDCIAIESDLPTPMCYDTLSSSEWPIVESGNTNGKYMWENNQVWRTDKGQAKASVAIQKPGKYYAYTMTYQYDTPRYFTATINGTPVKNASGDTFQFAKEGVAAENKRMVVLNICPQPVTLDAGVANIVLAQGSGSVRANFFALIPATYAYDANGALLDEVGEYESIHKFINETIGIPDLAIDGEDGSAVKESFMNFYIPDSRILNEISLSATAISEDSVFVKWTPTTFAIGRDITYTVYVDGEKKVDVLSTQPHQCVLELTPGSHTIMVKASIDAEGQETDVSVGAVAPVVSIDQVVENNKNIINSIVVDLLNLTGVDKNVAVFVATFENGKMTIEGNIAECNGLTYGKPDVAKITFDTPLETVLVDQAVELDASKSMTKIFVVDADTFVPYVY